jgi:hypothetical protein
MGQRRRLAPLARPMRRCGCPGHRRGGQHALRNSESLQSEKPVCLCQASCTDALRLAPPSKYKPIPNASVTVSRPWLLLFRRSNGQNKAVCNSILFLGVDRCCSCSLLAHAVVLYSFTSTRVTSLLCEL